MSNRYGNRYNRGRGNFRGHGNRSHHGQQQRDQNDDTNDSNTSSGSRGRPLGLRGRDIGLYYAQFSKQKREENQRRLEKDISIPAYKIQEIRKYLVDSKYLGESTETDVIDETARKLQMDYARVTQIDMEEQIQIAVSIKLSEANEENMQKTEKVVKSPLQEFRERLPCWDKRQIIVETINKNQVVLIKGETGCGKTTQVTQFILDEAIRTGTSCKIICTQPRRISAVTVAERVAYERGEKLGNSVGYNIRLDSVMPRNPNRSILYCTTGCVLKYLESDPALLQASHIILDEVHERDTNNDLLMGIFKIMIKYRKDLKIILMSATLNADIFAEYFDACPIVEVPGKIFPVQEYYLEDVLQMTNFTNFEEPRQQPSWVRFKTNYKDPAQELCNILSPHVKELKAKYGAKVVNALMNPQSESASLELIEELIFYISKNLPPGAILVFLPGYGLISKLCAALQKSSRFPDSRYKIYPLHSLLTGNDQKKVFERPPDGIRKIIISTNIAETSVTIDDVVYVINAGKRKLTNYDANTNVQILEEMWVSKANSKQRRGRAGRCSPGICFHLYSRAREETLDDDILPEIQRIRLDDVILSLKLLGVRDVKMFLQNLLSPPNPKIINYGIVLLKRLEAITVEEERLTPLGYHLARLPVDAQTGKMILFGALFSCLDPITSIAASLSFRDAFYYVMGKEKELDRIKLEFAKNTKSDHLMLANVIKEWRQAQEEGDYHFLRDNFLSYQTLRQLDEMKKQFFSLLCETQLIASTNPLAECNNKYSENEKVLKAVVCSGLYPNIAKIFGVKTRRNFADATPMIETKEDGKCSIHMSSVNAKQRAFDHQFLVYHLKQKTQKLNILDCTTVSPYSILFFGDMIETNKEQETIKVANYLKFKCDKETQKLLVDLRNALNQLLKEKIWTPTPIDWQAQDGALLK